MPLFAGRVLLREETMEGWLEVEDGRAKAWGDGPPPSKPDADGWIVPAPVNAHTHVADTFLRDVPGKPATVAELVGPGGWKQRHLHGADPAQATAGIQRHAQEMAAIGTAAFIDFREGGPAGAQRLQDLAVDLPVRPIVLGRPLRNDFREEEAAELLRVADGIGLSAQRDFEDAADVEAWAEAAHKARKPFALHASEAKREDMETVLALEPDFLVHGVQATKDDLAAMADAQVPLVVCPRSNARFGMRSPIRRIVDAGVQVAVGTDNGMLQDGNLLADLALLRRLDRDLGLDDLLRMATWNARGIAGLPPAWPPRRDQPLDLVVLPPEPLPALADARPGFTGTAVAEPT